MYVRRMQMDRYNVALSMTVEMLKALERARRFGIRGALVIANVAENGGMH